MIIIHGRGAAAVPWALVGGLAVSVRTEPRFTRDVDLVVAVRDDDAAETTARRFVAAGFVVASTIEQEATGRLATIRLTLGPEPDVGVGLDLLFASSGIEPEVVAAAEPLTILPGMPAPTLVARTGHLIALKLLSRSELRPTDDADLVALRAVAEPVDLQLALDAVRLIGARGYGRGRDLQEALSALLRRPVRGTS